MKKRAIILHLLLFFPFNENRKSFQQPPSPPASRGTFLLWTELCVECLPNKCFPKKCGMQDSAVTLDVSRRMIGKMKVFQVADAFFLDVQVMQEIRYPSGKLSWTLLSLEQQCSSTAHLRTFLSLLLYAKVAIGMTVGLGSQCGQEEADKLGLTLNVPLFSIKL